VTREILLAFIRASAPGSPITAIREDLLTLIEAENPGRSVEARGSHDRSPAPPSVSYVPLRAFASLIGKSEKTVRRWLRDGLLDGARRLPRRGGWIVPVNATPTIAETEVVASPPVASKPRARRPMPEDIAL
jgi:hypothetical protein